MGGTNEVHRLRVCPMSTHMTGHDCVSTCMSVTTHLNARAQGNAECQVALVLDGHKHGGDVFTGVAGDGQHDEA